MRIVCDTNVIVSGLLFGGHSRAILEAIASGTVKAYTSPALLHELHDVLMRRKFRLRQEQVNAMMELVRETFVCVSPEKELSVIVDDPDDDRVLEAALAARAPVIVSGDSHLISLGSWRSIEILNPADFVTWQRECEK
jgi:hypothetical protein